MHRRDAPARRGLDPRHLGPGQHRQPPRRLGLPQEGDIGGALVAQRAAPAALAAIVAGRSAVHRLGQDGAAVGLEGQAKPRARLDQTPRGGVERVGRLREGRGPGAARLHRGTGDADQPLGPVVVGREIVIGERPVGPRAVVAPQVEAAGVQALRLAHVMQRAAADTADMGIAGRGQPHPPRRAAGPDGVEALQRRIGGVERAQITIEDIAPAAGRGGKQPPLPIGLRHRVVARRIETRPGLEQQDTQPGLGQGECRRRATSARADDHDVGPIRHAAPHGGR